MEAYDAIVVGGGLVGSAIAYGLVRAKLKCVILDEGDGALRASRGNFGLVWVQGKGSGAPAYADWTMESASAWPDFAAELTETTGINLSLSQNGGIDLCLSEEEFEERDRKLATLALHQNGRFRYQMMDRSELAAHLPAVGPDVVGGSYSEHDGHVSPLYTLRALQAAFIAEGGEIRNNAQVERIKPEPGAFTLHTHSGVLSCGKLVLAAGLGNADLAASVGLNQPVYPLKGQILVTERMDRFLDLPTVHVRQTGEGSVMLGDSHEEAGFDTRSTPAVIQDIADRARRYFPQLHRARIVRTWGALRIMTPDGLPIYDQSEAFPGAFAASCHSGVTLAAAHAKTLAKYIARGQFGPELTGLSVRRFDV